MSVPRVVIVDYGLGNLFSVKRAFERVGTQVAISSDPAEAAGADRLVLPGVGAFGDGMKNLKQRGLDKAVENYARSGKPLLGICLGMQLLMSESEEFGLHQGLGLIPGRVIRFQLPKAGDIFKVPHIGWNIIRPPAARNNGSHFSWDQTVLNGIQEGSSVYFLHSYFVVPEDKEFSLAETSYGKDVFCSVIRKENVIGAQFHPERSGEIGLKIYHNFVKDGGPLHFFEDGGRLKALNS